MKKFMGKFRGKVENNIDPLRLGRIQVSVPAVLGDSTLSWAEPCLPYGGAGVGFFAIPPRGARVWVEFEDGNPDYPIWTGCFWTEAGDLPVPAPYTPEKKILKTDAGTITLNDSAQDSSITIETNKNPKLKIILNSQGIELTTGQGASIKLSGNKVSINGNALEVE
jgi:uncharacterized protein involved in type VI secretion and phage assembly